MFRHTGREEHTMIGFLLGVATGYVLGARAGRERYEQIVRSYHRVADHPAVQGAAGVAKAKVTDTVRSRVQAFRGSPPDDDTVAYTEPRTRPVSATSIPRAHPVTPPERPAVPYPDRGTPT
jgi:hypothetical protein